MERRFTDVHFRKRRTVVADPKVCAGCRTCELICSLTHEGCADPERSRIRVRSNSFQGSFLPQVCHQCSDAPCLYACPESAIEIEESFGTVQIDEGKCTGCRTCEEACPYKVIRFDAQKKKSFKCDFCHGHPECANWCPVNALGVAEFGGDIPR